MVSWRTTHHPRRMKGLVGIATPEEGNADVLWLPPPFLLAFPRPQQIYYFSTSQHIQPLSVILPTRFSSDSLIFIAKNTLVRNPMVGGTAIRGDCAHSPRACRRALASLSANTLFPSSCYLPCLYPCNPVAPRYPRSSRSFLTAVSISSFMFVSSDVLSHTCMNSILFSSSSLAATDHATA